jgi:hypothetical protein
MRSVYPVRGLHGFDGITRRNRITPITQIKPGGGG